ncbi:MAG TPA: hypothetical protein P5121_16465, partial [Caldilineaceae bacterium]|nr:hypothetical protein [Caldilineaceae bacterium]
TWLPPRHQKKGGLVLGVLFLLLGLYGYVGVIQPAFAPPPPVRAVSPSPQQMPIEWSELSLQSWQLDGDPVLYWRATVAPTQDWRVILRVVAADGTLVWEWRRSPAAGRWRTDRWPPDVIVRDAYQIRWPEWAGPGHYHVEVGLQPFGEEIIPPSRIGDALAQPEQQFVHLGEITR